MVRVKSTGNSSSCYGSCEKCGRTCSEVFHAFGFDKNNRYRDLFGCEQCAKAVADDGNDTSQEEAALAEIKAREQAEVNQ